MEFTKEEKLAMVKMVDYVILADSKVASEEMNLLTQLMDRFSFDALFIGQARNLKKIEALEILATMSFEKKKLLANLLEEVALSDGLVHEKEVFLIMEALDYMGLSREL
ncbi:TerB family tellurite resistance protein [Maribacter sp. X9]|uniref:TerB family tellurite resistance protein n=1 Tax=Maribacter sp. X9 TaxID=3402159 RepID=UPI003AF3F997